MTWVKGPAEGQTTWVPNAVVARREHYADALLVLIRAGEIVHGRGKTAMAVLGLTMPDMEAARTRAAKEAKGLNHPITPVAAPSPAPEPPKASSAQPAPFAPDPQRYHPNATRKRRTDDVGNLFCTRHDAGKGAWLPPDSFATRADYGKGARRSACRECMAEYNRARYLSVNAARVSGAVDDFVAVVYEHSPGDPAVTCPRCRSEIRDGERARLLGVPTHETCPEGATDG